MLGRGPGVGARSRLSVMVTCSIDGYAHQVDDAMLAEGVARGSGRLLTICGRSIVSAAMIDPPGTPCPLCAAVVDMDPPNEPGPRPSRRFF